MAKAFAKRFYSSAQWQRCRNDYAKQAHYLCERCLTRGLIVPGEIVHHKVELTPNNIDDVRITLGFDNLELVCRECHAEVHELDKGGFAAINERKRARREAGSRYRINPDGTVVGK